MDKNLNRDNWRNISFTAEFDKSRQFYIEMLPANFDRHKEYCVAIGLHGHGSDRHQFILDPRGECAAFREFVKKHNIIAVSPDYRATTSWMGPAAETDVVQIIKIIKKRYKTSKFFLIGGSMGGTSALTFAVLHPNMVDGITAMNPHANHVEYNNFQDAIAASFGGTKEQVPHEYKKRSAEFFPEKLTMPLAITTGGKDIIVPPQSMLRLIEKLKKFNGKVFHIHRPETGHETAFEDAFTAMEFMYNSTTK